ncbi:hypothetical protein NIBR502772_05890 [Pseudarthrobacter sp. NIBRBAC000502772]|uniref:DUF6221 family protein n=1 Tax=Pseudarthrobacter sp. NIBRBAC000502772 TaxID=2590775 RepID=UPI001131D801|nr:DUF6221 family protein [Pseudarthrobacter sp. NIBRBAC000502772]QDG65805.1 hypothetical protein NIBR502772_05890 [Pseudarthrobacter sp. NIBRBAC000502772]
MTITEFLEARIEEDEMRAGSGWARLGDTRWETDNYGRDTLTPSAVLAECAAKRAILKEHEIDLHMSQPYCDTCAEWWASELGEGPPPVKFPCPTIRALAAVYKDHPDYQKEWKQ